MATTTKTYGEHLKDSQNRIKEMVKKGTELTVTISKGNQKLGSIPSISFPAVTTCVKCECNQSCYAIRGRQLYSQILDSYTRNLWIYKHNPDDFWRSVEASIMTSRYFRYFASGDIPDYNFFDMMTKIASENPHCRQLCFTKKFDIVNEWIEKNGEIPSNLQIIFSGWRGLEMKNPNNLPECHIRYYDGTTTAKTQAWTYECTGSCTECFINKCGCFSLMKGQQVIINQHGTPKKVAK